MFKTCKTGSLPADRSGALREKMLVWAVDGLAGVILGGVAGANTSRQRKPRSLLWGSHEGQLNPWSGIGFKTLIQGIFWSNIS